MIISNQQRDCENAVPFSVSKKYNRQEQYVFTPPSDEGGAERLSEAEGEITKHHINTPIIDSSRIISIVTHCIESGFFFVLYSCVISPPPI